MNFTYRNHVWKGESTNSVIPSNSRPFSNNDDNLKTLERTSFKANPIKHWRKQLLPKYPTRSSKQITLQKIEAPNTSIYIGKNNTNCETNNTKLLKENIVLLNKCNGIQCVDGVKSNLKRSASTNVSVNYYSNYNKYLKSKCNTYEQNSTLGSKQSSQVYHSSLCHSSSCKKPIIYKPSNHSFSNQGSVSASSYLLRKKQNALNSNAHNLKKTFPNPYEKKITHNTNLPSFC